MGRQIQIRMAAEDRAWLDREISQAGGVLLLTTHASSVPIVVPSSHVVEQRFRGSFWICLANEIGQVRLEHVATMDYWVVNGLSSPVMEYGCYDTAGSPTCQGRLWYEKGYFDQSGMWVCRSDAFLQFAERLFRLVRRRFTRDPATSEYVGPQALHLMHSQ